MADIPEVIPVRSTREWGNTVRAITIGVQGGKPGAVGQYTLSEDQHEQTGTVVSGDTRHYPISRQVQLVKLHNTGDVDLAVTVQRQLDIGPADLQAVKGSPFLLSQAEWYSLQRYVTNALQLPTTEDTMRHLLDMPSDMSFSDFEALRAGYATIHPHVLQWRDAIFPATVDLAANIVHYSIAAPTYYGAMREAIDTLLDDSRDEEAKETLRGIIADRAAEAGNFADKAAQVYADIEQFAKDTEDDRARLDGLAETYERKYGHESEHVQTLLKDIDAQQALISQETAEYEHDVIVAATTPTYAWVLPFLPIGLVPAAIVAGIYGDRAVRALERLKAAEAQVRSLNADLQRSILLVNTISRARDALGNIQKDIAAALPSIQKIQTVWNAIKRDLEHIGTLIEQDINQAVLEIKEVGIDKAIEQWQAVAQKADAYRAHAFIEVPAELRAA